jgi:hypothetical protein
LPPEPLAESPEFTDLFDKLRGLFLELPKATKEEKAAHQRFVANAPLPSRRSKRRAAQDRISLVVVRERPSLEAIKKTVARKPGAPVLFPVSLDYAYDELRANPLDAKEGEAFRRMAGISRRYEWRLFASAHDTGYAAARSRRLKIQSDTRTAIDAFLKQDP